MELIIGSLLGFLSGLGVGGGSLLLLWLTLGVGMDAEEARCINLLFFFPTAIFASFFRLRNLRASQFIIPALIGCIGTAIFSIISQGWDPTLLRKGFGIFLLIIAIRELRTKRKE